MLQNFASLATKTADQNHPISYLIRVYIPRKQANASWLSTFHSEILLNCNLRYPLFTRYFCFLFRSMILIKRIFFVVFLLLIILSVAGIIIHWKYADELKEKALQAIRSTIETDATFNDDISVSLWQDFPLIAVEIREVYIQDAFRTDTLLAAKKTFVQFNLIKIIRGNYSIAGISVSDGFLRLKRNKHDRWNYHVWKTDTASAKKKIDFSIETLALENIELRYDDRMVDLHIHFFSQNSKIKGRFTDENQRLNLSLNGFMHQLVITGKDRIVSLPLSVAGVLNIRSKEKIYTVEMGNAMLANNEMVWNGEWKRDQNGDMNMRLKVHADNMAPDVLLPHLWPQIPENIRKLKLKGNSDFILTMEGPFTKTHGPELAATISMKSGQLLFQKTQVSDLNFEGNLFMHDIKRSKAMRLQFESFDLKTPQGNVKGTGTLIDLSNPYLKINSTGTSRLEEIIGVTGISNQIKGSGNVAWNIAFEGPLGKDFNTTLKELRKMNWSGDINLSEAEMEFNTGIPILKNLVATISMATNQTNVKNCSGTIGHITFDGSLQMPDLKSIIIEKTQPILLNGNIHIKELNIAALPQEWQFETKTEAATEPSRIVTLQVNTEVDLIRYRNFTATNISGKMQIENDLLKVSNLQFKTLDGSAKANLIYHPVKTGYQLNIDAKLVDINMSRALFEWDNFGQNTIASQNLKGRSTAQIEAHIFVNKNYEIVKEKLRIETDIEISGGELINFEPLLAISKFISVDELKHVKFDTLRNHISIKDSRLFIPKMSIESNILNVDIFGEQGFNREMDYHINLLLNDILRRKTKKKKTFDGHEILDEKGKTRLFLWIRGMPDNLKVGFDKQEISKKIKTDFRKEGQTIKQLFKEEFGGRKNKITEQETIQFRLEENEDSAAPEAKNQSETKTEEPKKKKKRGFFNAEKEEDETEGGFEIEFDP